MAEHSAEFEWRRDGEEAEVVVYAPDESVAETAFERALPASTLPGVQSPVYAAASEQGFGLVAASASHVSPDLISAPERGVLLAAGVAAENIGMRLEDLPRLISRNLSETRLPALNEAGVMRACGQGARAAAEDGLIEEEDLAFLELPLAEPDSLSRRALSAGTRDYGVHGRFGAYTVGELLDSERAESLGIEAGALALVLRVGTGELGRIALEVHRRRIEERVESGEFETDSSLPAAPLDTEEAADLLVASSAAANFADARAALLLYALRRALEETVGDLAPLASWTVGGLETSGGPALHRKQLAALGSGGTTVSGESVAATTGVMLGSSPLFGAAEVEGRWPWEEAGLLERVAELHPVERGR